MKNLSMNYKHCRIAHYHCVLINCVSETNCCDHKSSVRLHILTSLRVPYETAADHRVDFVYIIVLPVCSSVGITVSIVSRQSGDIDWATVHYSYKYMSCIFTLYINMFSKTSDIARKCCVLLTDKMPAKVCSKTGWYLTAVTSAL